MSIDIQNESGVAIDEARMLALASHALAKLKVHSAADLSVLLLDEPPMEELHIRYLDEPGPTDVLSFPMDELKPGTDSEPTPAGMLGSIAICPQVAEAQAKAAGHSLMEEVLLLLTHGILHLLGFDHAEPEEELEMFSLQREILTSFYESESA